MFTQSSTSSTASAPSSTHSSRSPSPDQFQDARSTPSPPPSPFYTPSGSPPPQSESSHRTDPQLTSTILESPPLDFRPYIPHAVGLGIAAPRPVFGPFSPFHKDEIAKLQANASPIRTPSNPFDSPSILVTSSHSTVLRNPFDPSNAGSPLHSPPIISDRKSPFIPSDSNHIDPVLPASQPHTPLPPFGLSNSLSEDVDVPKPASNPLASPQSETSPSLQRPMSPPPNLVADAVLNHDATFDPSHSFGTDISNSGRRPSIDLGTVPAVTSPEALAGPANSLTPSNPLTVNPLDEAVAANTLASVTDDPSQFLSEIDADGLSAIEKIYLFSKSRLAFHRVYIAKSLSSFLQTGSDDNITSHPQDGALNPDLISTEEAVEYVLPLLNGLATDEDEAVKEALAGELVSIIWWYITRCKLVEDDTVLAVDEGAEDIPLQQGTDILDHPYHVDQSPLPNGPSHHHSGSQDRAMSPSPFTNSHLSDIVRSPNARPPTPRPSTPGASTPRPLSPAPPETVSLRPPTPPPPTLISVQSFTPMLGTLLLSTNALVGGPARFAVVELLKRVRRADQVEDETITGSTQQEDVVISNREQAHSSESSSTTHSGSSGSDSKQKSSSATDFDEDDEYPAVGLFGKTERRLFEREMIHQVVIGMGRLDIDFSEDYFSMDVDSNSSQVATNDSESTASVPTPPEITPSASESMDSYFPPMPPIIDPESSKASTSSSSPPPDSSSPPPVSPNDVSSDSSQDETSTSDSMTSSPELSSQSPGSSPPTVPLSWAPTPSLVPSSSNPDPSSPPSSIAETNSTPMASSSFSPFSPTSSEGQTGSTETTPWPRSPGGIPPSSEEERRKWEQNLASGIPTNFALHPGMGMSEASPTLHPSMSEVPNWSDGLQSGSTEAVDNSAHEEHDFSAEAAVGRLSSMSLMAAVTASGTIAEETKAAFVTEVERIGHDTIYWVRREASFTVGALAKVVSVEVVKNQLLPLFRSFVQDSVWQVRHSALFSLPNILSRLELEEKRQLALEVILSLAKDEQHTVRSGVLEALAEVMYTFADDEGGPPSELVRLFLGLRDGATKPDPFPPQEMYTTATTSFSDYMAWAKENPIIAEPEKLDIYNDTTRPLVCAFNFPAVALTLGHDRWPELRSLYHDLSVYRSPKVQTTLAASLGELAKIVGHQYAKEDLMDVWYGSVRAQESEVRQKAVQCLGMFVEHISEECRRDVFDAILNELWDQKFRNWREREGIMKHMPNFISTGVVQEEVLVKLFAKGLEDSTAAVREAAIALIPVFISKWAHSPEWLNRVFEIFKPFATSGSFRKRILYVACQQEVVVSGNSHFLVDDEEFWHAMQILAGDKIVDVRLRVARLLGALSDNVQNPSDCVKTSLRSLAEKLSGDTSHDVQAFAKPILDEHHPVFHPRNGSASVIKSTANFSRPPPPSSG